MKLIQIALLLLLCSVTAQSETLTTNDRSYIDNIAIRPGDTRLVEIFIDNTEVPWRTLNTWIELPPGLEFVKLTANDIAGLDYTLDHVQDEHSEDWFDFSTESYAAISCSFKNPDCQVHDSYYQYLLQEGQWEWFQSLEACMEGTKLRVYVGDVEMKTSVFAGREHFPIAIIKIKADDNLQPSSVVKVNSLFGSAYLGNYNGQDAASSVICEYYIPVNMASVSYRPVDIADVNAIINVMLSRQGAQMWGWYDHNGDGVVDISDVNAMINEMLGKTHEGYDIPTGNTGHDTSSGPENNAEYTLEN